MTMRLLQFYLYCLSKLMLGVKRPTVIGVTGNFGKTSTVAAIITVLRAKFSVRGPEKNFNNEIGVPLTILGWPNHRRNILGWIIELVRFPFQLLVMSYPQFLVLEMGVDKPGDMAYLTRLVRPHVGVVTGVGEIPVHVEFFGSPEAVAREKAGLVRAVPNNGLVVLNADDLHSALMRSDAGAPVKTYGTAHLSDYKVEHFEISYGDNQFPEGMKFTIEVNGVAHPVRLAGSLNSPQALVAAAAFAVGAHFGLPSQKIMESLEKLKTPSGRMKLIPGSHNSLILDDTYNAAPQAVESALKTLAVIRGKRRVAILGDMKELGVFNDEAHKKVALLAKESADLLITTGHSMSTAAEAVGASHGSQYAFHTSIEARDKVNALIQEGDVILVKGAQSMRMERVVEAIMAEPDRASELLVRQSKDWKNITI